jgi:hypothetical protein
MCVKQILAYCCVIFQLNSVEMCLNEINICITCGKLGEKYLKLKLGSSNRQL